MPGGSPPLAKDLVLVGGGHAHALVIRRWAMQAWQGVRLTLVSEVSYAPYSGMLPGLVAGDYSFEDAHIDLRRLCSYAGVRFIDAAASGLDLNARLIYCGEKRPPLRYDLLSLNIGSTPVMPPQWSSSQTSSPVEVPQSLNPHVVPVKPVGLLLAQLPAMEALSKRRGPQGVRICIIGGGVGGVELSMALRQRFAAARLTLHLSLVEQGPHILAQVNAKAQHILQHCLARAQVQTHLGQAVQTLHHDHAVLDHGAVVQADFFLVVTSAQAPAWIKDSGLAVDERGFALVNNNLQSLSHPLVFAAGDIAHIHEQACPKAGVFAVRQAKPLWVNLQRQLASRRLQAYRPQRHFLSLVRVGAGEAVGVWGPFASCGRWLGRYKNFIDRRFMQRFAQLPSVMAGAKKPAGKQARVLAGLSVEVQSLEAQTLMRCRGCAAKWSGSLLKRVLSRIQQEAEQGGSADAVRCLRENDDASLCELPPHKTLAQTIDYMPALVSDPFLFGRILVNHCFGDIVAMGAVPHSAQLLAVLPFAADSIVAEDAYQLLQGVIMQMQVVGGANLLGGHTAEGPEFAAGLCCNGLADPGAVWRKGGMVSGDALILTRGLGIGVLFAAEMRQATEARFIDAAMATMLQTQHTLKSLLEGLQIHACTDITGFGLLGHVFEMADASHAAVHLQLEALPRLAGAWEAWTGGIRSSLHTSNLAYLQHAQWDARSVSAEHLAMLADPQTAGPLLFALPRQEADEAIGRLRAAGFAEAAVIGHVAERSGLPLHLAL